MLLRLIFPLRYPRPFFDWGTSRASLAGIRHLSPVSKYSCFRLSSSPLFSFSSISSRNARVFSQAYFQFRRYLFVFLCRFCLFYPFLCLFPAVVVVDTAKNRRLLHYRQVSGLAILRHYLIGTSFGAPLLFMLSLEYRHSNKTSVGARRSHLLSCPHSLIMVLVNGVSLLSVCPTNNASRVFSLSRCMAQFRFHKHYCRVPTFIRLEILLLCGICVSVSAYLHCQFFSNTTAVRSSSIPAGFVMECV